MMKSTLLLLVLFIGLYETKKKSKHYLVETVDNHEDGTDYKIGDNRGIPTNTQKSMIKRHFGLLIFMSFLYKFKAMSI